MNEPGGKLQLALRPDAAAEAFGVSRRTLDELLAKGEIKSVKLPRPLRLGHALRWRRAEVLAWVEQGCPSMRKAVRRG